MERRRVLAGIGTAAAAAGLAPLLSACTDDNESGSATPTSSASSSGPAAGPRATAAATETALLSLATEVLAKFPVTASAVEPVRDGHSAHVVALVGTTPSATPPADAAAGRLPATAASALRLLASRERAASREHATGALAADAPGARLLASIASFSAAQDLVLTRAADTTGVGR